MSGSKPTLAAHAAALRDLGCVISGYRGPVELHHCMGGSMRQFGQLRGVGMKSSDWLQIPLAKQFHTGDLGIDVLGIETWEHTFGTQVEHLEAVCAQLGYDVFALAGIER